MGLRDTVGRIIKSFYTADPSRPLPEQRKGLFGFASALVQKKQQKPYVINAATMERLANTDPVTWAIIRTIKSRVNSTKWDIVPDTARTEKELDRWEEYAVESLNPYGLTDEPFVSKLIDQGLFDATSKKLDTLMQDTSLTDQQKSKAIRWLFKSIKRQVIYDAQMHCEEVRKVFERPNDDSETSLRALQELVLNDLLVFDAGVIIKNYSRTGKLAELYTVPGHQIKLYREEDRTTPQPPEPAYVWEDNGIMRAEFTNDELLYICQNPTQNGYGRSALETAAYIITASILAEQYNIDYFKNSNVPPGVMNLGKDITEEQRSLFQALWDNEVQGRAGGLHRMLFMAGSDQAKFIPLNNLSNRDMQMMEYMKWTVAIKCACYGLSPQDIGFTGEFHGLGSGGVADTQKGLTEARGIKSLLQLLEQYYNAEIVKSEFPYIDIKFEWQPEEASDSKEEADIDVADIQQGVMSRNERRVKKGLKPIPGGDIVTVTTSGGLLPVEGLEQQDQNSLQEELGTPTPTAGESQENADGSLAPTDGSAPVDEQGQPGDQPSQDNTEEVAPGLKMDKQRTIVRRPVVKIVAKKNSRKLDKKMDDAVRKMRESGIDAELRIGFGE